MIETDNILDAKLLSVLLKDQSVSFHFKKENNIFWATSDYEAMGEGYGYLDQITIEKITGEHSNVIIPRAKKSHEVQRQRVQEKAEVFSPTWVCNAMNNHLDEARFGRKGVFNTEFVENRKHWWAPTEEKIQFPDAEGKSWQDYVRSCRMEITCGEAPFITSRYDVTQFEEVIPVKSRIGFLDRKLRVVGENTSSPEEWIEWGKIALKATFGYDWQGDNLLLAREAVLFTFIEHYEDQFHEIPDRKTIEEAAYIISWNLWQMDGQKGVVPLSCEWAAPNEIGNLFGGAAEKMQCPTCQKDSFKISVKQMFSGHIGIQCLLKDWFVDGEPIIKFSSLLK